MLNVTEKELTKIGLIQLRAFLVGDTKVGNSNIFHSSPYNLKTNLITIETGLTAP